MIGHDMENITKIIGVKTWMHGGFSVSYLDNDGIEHQFFPNPSDEKGEGEFSTFPLAGLYKALTELIVRLEHTDVPIETQNIGEVSRMIIAEIDERTQNLEATRARRNKLIRNLRKEVKRLKK